MLLQKGKFKYCQSFQWETFLLLICICYTFSALYMYFFLLYFFSIVVKLLYIFLVNIEIWIWLRTLWRYYFSDTRVREQLCTEITQHLVKGCNPVLCDKCYWCSSYWVARDTILLFYKRKHIRFYKCEVIATMCELDVLLNRYVSWNNNVTYWEIRWFSRPFRCQMVRILNMFVMGAHFVDMAEIVSILIFAKHTSAQHEQVWLCVKYVFLQKLNFRQNLQVCVHTLVEFW